MEGGPMGPRREGEVHGGYERTMREGREEYVPPHWPALPDVEERSHPFAILPRISWGAVIAGSVVVLAMMIMLNMLGAGIGLLSINPTEEGSLLGGIGTGAAVWWVVTWLIALFVGGWVAGRVSGRLRGFAGGIHGFVTWGLSAVVVFWMLWTGVAGVVGLTTHTTGQLMQAAGRGVTGLISGMGGDGEAGQAGQESGIIQELRAQAQQVLQREDLPPELVDMRMSEIEEVLGRLVRAAIDPQQDLNREMIVNTLAQSTRLSQQESERVAVVWEEQIQEARQQLAQLEQQARQTAENVTSAVGKAAIIGFFVLLVGAVAGTLGGWLGTPHTVELVRSNRMKDEQAA